MVGNDTEKKVNPYGPRENYLVEKQGIQDPNPGESGFQK